MAKSNSVQIHSDRNLTPIYFHHRNLLPFLIFLDQSLSNIPDIIQQLNIGLHCLIDQSSQYELSRNCFLLVILLFSNVEDCVEGFLAYFEPTV